MIERNGKYYMYCPVHGQGIGGSDSPHGPFTDPLGKALIHQNHDDIDPTVFIDDDGQAYMYWGNSNLYYVKLNEDMISCSGDIMKDYTKIDNYQEGPWLYKGMVMDGDNRSNGNHPGIIDYKSKSCDLGFDNVMAKQTTIKHYNYDLW